MYCASCGFPVSPTMLSCSNCGTEIDLGSIVDSVDESQETVPVAIEPQGTIGNNGLPSLSKFIPTRDEKIVTCAKCGGENRRGDVNCQHCGNLIVPLSEHDELINIDNKIVRKIDPKRQTMCFKLACQLLIIKFNKKLVPYPCRVPVQTPEGDEVACGYMLQFWMESCPKCGTPNGMYYVCGKKQESSRCMQKIGMNDMKCPSCGEPTLLADLMSVINGENRGSITVEFIDKLLQPHFPQFPLLRKTLSVTISHSRLVEMKFDLESVCERFSTILNYLADFLEIATKRQGSGGMSTIYQNFNPAALLNSVTGSPEASDSLNELLDQRETQLRATAANEQANMSPVIDEGGGGGGNDSNDDDDDDPFAFGI